MVNIQLDYDTNNENSEHQISEIKFYNKNQSNDDQIINLGGVSNTFSVALNYDDGLYMGPLFAGTPLQGNSSYSFGYDTLLGMNLLPEKTCQGCTDGFY